MSQRYANIIRACRKYAGLTQRQLAERILSDAQTISRYEMDKITPRLETFEDILNACGFRMRVDVLERKEKK